MSLLVVGSTGLLGTALTAQLSTQTKVFGLARKAASASPDAVSFLEQDVTEFSSLERVIGDLAPEAVVLTAAQSNVDACERDPESAYPINVLVPQRLAQLSKQYGFQFLHISTDYVFDGQGEVPYVEDAPLAPISAYAKLKVEAEEKVLEAAPESLVLRVSGLYGHARSNFVTQTIDNLLAGQPVRVVEQALSPSNVEDLAEAMAQLIFSEQAYSGVFHLANTGEATRTNVATELAARLGIEDPKIEHVSWEGLALPAKRPLYTCLDCQKLASVAGVHMRSWQAALKDFVDSYQRA